MYKVKAKPQRRGFALYLLDILQGRNKVTSFEGARAVTALTSVEIF